MNKGINKIIERIGSYDWIDITIITVTYYLMLSVIMYKIPTILRIPFYTIIIVTALYACAEEPKNNTSHNAQREK